MGRAVHTGQGIMLDSPKRFLVSTMNGQRCRESFVESAANVMNLVRCIDVYSPELGVNAQEHTRIRESKQFMYLPNTARLRHKVCLCLPISSLIV